MAWIVVELDETLLQSTEPGQSQPTEGAVEAMQVLAGEGHRLTVYTSRFAPMPESEKQRLKEEFEHELAAWGFPPMEVWTGTTKPDADVFLGHNHVTYDNDWGLALAQMQVMLEEKGLIPSVQPGMEGDPTDEEMPPVGEGEEPPP
jgi:hypothetical protein